ncbi:MAG: iron ABC transporter substrate-binding protein [Chloroflexi bacterium]|nr:iron ABC transporter substrate-binding protein [Chloroflexota bacterium]
MSKRHESRVRTRLHTPFLFILFALLATLALTACQPVATESPTSQAEPQPDPEAPSQPEPEDLSAAKLVIYSGRNENLVGPLIEQFEQKSGIEVAVRYGGTAEMAATILEEGKNSPADVFYGQDAGALAALSSAGRFMTLPDDILTRVPGKFRSRQGDWVGTSGRARVVVYNTNHVDEADLPDSIWGFADPAWKGRLGWAPTNGSFQAFVTALRALEGEERAREWLEAMLANEIRSYPKNSAIVEAVGRGEIDAGFVNHYYLLRFLAEQGDDFPARNYYLPAGGAGSLINVAGAGILNTGKHHPAAQAFLEFLLSPAAQGYFAETTNEYPLIEGVSTSDKLPPLEQIKTPDIDLNDLEDLQGTLELLQEVGAFDSM